MQRTTVYNYNRFIIQVIGLYLLDKPRDGLVRVVKGRKPYEVSIVLNIQILDINRNIFMNSNSK